ncbi:DUF3267 domain-containing protein [Adhaeribacter swui]|uniref:DUF3267 domain-containing protein n=1 Tax=Adhaeribacter swui TaxID=2086471 RepID=A0A7G7G7K9_9BACT|nr:DUF3267 domain-containing protein [Adhaeribacter swui]QNF33143.1 DUF3267 domain-containing protein [Adhaeribacter swui]
MTNTQAYQQQELTVNAGKAQLQAVLYFIPFIALFGLPYYLLWGSQLTKENYKNVIPGTGLVGFAFLIGIIFIGILVHELIHGLTWASFAKQGYKSMRYGVLWKSFTPYCHCKEPLRVKHYIIGALMPAILLGILPSVLALITGNLGLLLFGLFFTLAAGGDFLIVSLLRKEPFHHLVQDHPSKIGCYIYKSVQ